MTVLITGAAGNLGSRLARHLLNSPHQLRLLVHKSPLPRVLAENARTEVYRADLSDPRTLTSACDGSECIVHLAGVLFAPRPERFLPQTNIGFVCNLLEAAQRAGVRRFILISFPHVEGETTPQHPATDRLDATPNVIHFRTRLEAERRVLEQCAAGGMTPVILRAGVVYGPGVKLIEGARWLLRRRMFAVWARPTWVHLVALPDFLNAVQAAIEKDGVRGIYNVCDDRPLTLQEFLDRLAAHFGYRRPWRLPEWTFRFAGSACELLASVLGTAAPLTRDIVRAGMTSAVADNARMKRELLPILLYPTLEDGLTIL
jgi:nucleoside-diphosphate-sugar epimerase